MTDDDTPVLRYVALGDSYTVGTAVTEDERWPNQLVARLDADPPAHRLRLVANHAVNGWAARDVLRGQCPWLASESDLGFVSILVGVNDVVQGVTEFMYRADVEAILDVLLGRLPPDRILAVETPDYTVTPMGAAFGDPATQRAAIGKLNATFAKACGKRRIAFVDGIFALSAAAAGDPALVAPDGLHPSGAQYRRWVEERIEPAVRTLLG
jgi:lysophospholipase L1-like esterase